jgi:hypothetical protein
MTSWLATVGIVISGAALAISSLSALFARRQLQLAERSRGRDFEATVVAELIEVHRAEDAIRFDDQVTNADPAVARDVDVSLVEWGGTSLGTVLAEAKSHLHSCTVSDAQSLSNFRMRRRPWIEMSRWNCTPTTSTTAAFVTSASHS